MEKAKDFLQKKRNRVAVAFAAAVILGIAVYFMTNSGEDSAEVLYKAEKELAGQKREETAVGIQNYQGGLHPAFAEYSGEKTLSDLLFSPLIRIKQDGSIDYILAEDIDVSSKGKTYTVRLKDGLKYSDGSKLAAADVKKDLLLLGDGRSSFGFRDCFARLKGYDSNKLTQSEDMEGIEVKDDITLVFHFTEPDPANMYLFTGGIGRTANRAKNKYLYTGAFMLKGQPANLPMTLEANPNYYDGKVKEKNILVKNINSNNIEAMLTKGNVDITQFQANKSLISRLKKSGVITLYHGSSDVQAVLDFKSDSKSAVNKKEVRQAVCYAFQKERFVTDSLGDSGQVAFSNFKEGSFMAGAEKEMYPYSKEKAEEWLKNAGYEKNKKGIFEKGGKELSLTLKADGILYADLFVQQFTKDMKAAGIIVKTTDSGNYDLYYRNAAIPSLTSVGAFLDERNFQDEKLVSLNARLKKAEDLKEAGKVCKEIDEKILNESLTMPVYTERKFAAVGNGSHKIEVKDIDRPFSELLK